MAAAMALAAPMGAARVPKQQHQQQNRQQQQQQRHCVDCNGGELFFATCSPGLEEVVAAELWSYGAANVRIGSAGVSFEGASLGAGFKACLCLRSAVRVLHRIAQADLRSSRDPVYDFVRNATQWRTLLKKSGPTEFRTFSVQSRVWDCTGVSTSVLACTRAKDAICDAVRDSCSGKRPEPPPSAALAQVPLFLSLYRDRAVLYRDLCGTSLHMRGYRDVMHKASLNESVAAAMLILSGWDRASFPAFGAQNKGSGRKQLLDPMCGSGTILIEAALMAINRAPGLLRRHWPFMDWHDFEGEEWEECVAAARKAQVDPPEGLKLMGNDIHEGALALCERDAERAGVRRYIELSQKDCRSFKPSVSPSVVMVNPPWGSRLGDEDTSLTATYMGLGQFLKRECRQADVYMLSGNSKLSRHLQMKADRKWPLRVGGLDCRLLHYHVLPPKPPVEKQQESICSNHTLI